MPDKKISELTATTTLGDTDLVTTVQGGINKKLTGANLKTAIQLLVDNSTDLAPVNARGFDIQVGEQYKVAGADILETQIAEFNTGFYQWTSGSDANTYTVDGTGFQVNRSGRGGIKSQWVDWIADQKTAPLAINKTSFIYVNSSGILAATSTPNSELYLSNIVLFEVLFDGTNYIVVKENHPYNFQTSQSAYLHKNVGTVIEGVGAVITRVAVGAGASADDRRIKIVGADVLADHGLETTISETDPATWNIYYTNGSGNWIRNAQDSEVPMLYNNTGTPTAITDGRYSVYVIYVSKDDIESTTPTYFATMDNSEYSNITQARGAIIANNIVRSTNELSAIELCQLGYAIVLNNASGGYISELIVEKATFNSRVVGGGQTTNHNLLDGLLLAASGVTYGHIDDQPQTISGAKSYTAAPIFNSLGLNVDFTININGGTSGYHLDGGTGTSTYNGILRTTDGSVIHNYQYQDNDYEIRQITSGTAYKYDAELKTHTFNGAELSLNDNQGSMNVFIRKKTSGDAFEYNADTGVMVIDLAALILSPALAVINGGTALTSYTLGQSLWGNSSNELTANTPVAGTGMSIAHDVTTGQPTFNADGTGGITATNATYFNKAGGSENNGLAHETAKDAIANAITVAQALTPAVDKLIAVNCDDGGIYTEYDFTSKPHINLNASDASIVAGTEDQSYIGSNNTVRVKSQTMTSSTDTPILVKNGSGDSKYISEYLGDTVSTASLLAVSGGGTLNSFIDVMEGANRNISAINVTSGHINHKGIDVTGKLDIAASQSINADITGDWDGDFITASSVTGHINITGNWTGDITAGASNNLTITCGSRTLDSESDSIDDSAVVRIDVKNIGNDNTWSPARDGATTNYNVSPADTGKIITNQNTNTAGDALNLALPPSAPNLHYRVSAVRLGSRVITIGLDGSDTFLTEHNVSISSAISSGAKGSYIEMFGSDIGIWYIVQQNGQWSNVSANTNINVFTSSRSLVYTDVNTTLYTVTDSALTLTIDDTTNANTAIGAVIKIARMQTTVTATSLQILTGGSAVIVSREANNYVANPSNNKPHVAFVAATKLTATTWALEGDVSATAN